MCAQFRVFFAISVAPLSSELNANFWLTNHVAGEGELKKSRLLKGKARLKYNAS